MKALSIREPWVECILRGWKPEEFRTWRCDYRGPMLLHSARTLDREMADAALYARLGLAGIRSLPEHEARRWWPHPLGHVRGVARVVGCRRRSTRGSRRVVYGWQLADVHRLEHPFSLRGQLNLFDVDLDDVADVDTCREIAAWLAGLRYPAPRHREAGR